MLLRRLYSRLDSRYEPLVSAVEADLLRLFLVTAHNAKRPDKVAEFFKLYGPQLLSNSRSRSGVGIEDVSDWKDWFVLPYLQHPEREQRFQVSQVGAIGSRYTEMTLVGACFLS